jgi:hypothetical protein
MECSKCKKGAVFFARHFGVYFCRKHLEEYLFKKLRRNLCRNGLVKKGDKLRLRVDSSPAGQCAKKLFLKAVKGWPVGIVKSGGKLVDFATLESETDNTIVSLAKGKIFRTGYKIGSTIKPFRDFPEKELFTLGLAGGAKKPATKKARMKDSLPTAARLNLLRVWDSILEFLKPRRGRTKIAEGLK